ncbi:MAG: hypothetical protein ACYTKC_07090 [Planctomycetota bacterium]|jgi:hypothetical protein
MGHVVFGIPRIEHFHLHSRLRRRLADRGHRITVLAPDPVTLEFYRAQGMRVVDVPPTRPRLAETLASQAPVSEFARIDCMLRRQSMPTRRQLRRAQRPLAMVLGGLTSFFETDPPDLLYLHQGRTGLHRLLHFLGRQHGAQVLHTGEGLLPHTMQWDTEGIDGDASFVRHNAQDYRRQERDEVFLGAALSAWLARAYPPPLARVGLRRPDFLERLKASALAALRGQWSVALGGLGAWQRAYTPAFPRRQDQPAVPQVPFVVVLLQPEHSQRLILDSAGQVAHRHLIQVARAAVQRVGAGIPTVVVLPPAGVDRAAVLRLQDDLQDLIFLPPGAAALAVSTAMAVITVNHPLGLCAILSGTPVLHLGRTPYGVRGVAHRTSLDLLAEDLGPALTTDHPTLRQRFLTKMLKDHHLWCAVHHPDTNGIAGLILKMEELMAERPENARILHYRSGPVWPLSVPPKKER